MKKGDSMKFTKIVLATLLAAGITAGTAQAQSTQLYGVAGAGIVSGSGFSSSDSTFQGLGEQLHNSNRFGIKSSEDLGDGLKATLTLEGNMSLRTGGAGKDSAGTGSGSSTLFDREANVALSGGFGEVKLGRGKTHLYSVADEFDSRSNWNFGGLKPIARYAGFYGGSGVSRFDNMVRYTSPSFGGLVVDGAYSFGNQLDNNDYKKSYNVGGTYTAGALALAYSRAEVRLSTAVVSETIDLVAAKYAVSPALAVNAGYAITRNPTAQTTFYSSSSKVDGKTDANTWFVGAKYKVNANVGVNAGYYNVQDKVTAGKDDVKMTAVGATYDFSKRTQVFVDYVVANRASGAVSPFTIYDRWVPNGDGSTYADSKYKQQAVAVGVQYRF
jgi:GBP family porin